MFAGKSMHAQTTYRRSVTEAELHESLEYAQGFLEQQMHPVLQSSHGLQSFLQWCCERVVQSLPGPVHDEETVSNTFRSMTGYLQTLPYQARWTKRFPYSGGLRMMAGAMAYCTQRRTSVLTRILKACVSFPEYILDFNREVQWNALEGSRVTGLVLFALSQLTRHESWAMTTPIPTAVPLLKRKRKPTQVASAPKKVRTLPHQINNNMYLWSDPREQNTHRVCNSAKHVRMRCDCRLLEVQTPHGILAHRYHGAHDLQWVVESDPRLAPLTLFIPGCSMPVYMMCGLTTVLPPRHTILTVTEPSPPLKALDRWFSTNAVATGKFELISKQAMLQQGEALAAIQNSRGTRLFDVHVKISSETLSGLNSIISLSDARNCSILSLQDKLQWAVRHYSLPESSMLLRIRVSHRYHDSIVCHKCRQLSAGELLNSGFLRVPEEDGPALLCCHESPEIHRSLCYMRAMTTAEQIKYRLKTVERMKKAWRDVKAALLMHYRELAGVEDSVPAEELWTHLQPEQIIRTRRKVKQHVRHWLRSEMIGLQERLVWSEAHYLTMAALGYDIERLQGMGDVKLTRAERKLPHFQYPGLVTGVQTVPSFFPLVRARTTL